MNVLLIGLRCSGKTTLAPALAARLGFASVEMDELVTRELGCASAGEAIAKDEVEFRKTEAAVLARLMMLDSCVISAGGGTPTAPDAPDLIRDAQDRGRLCVLYLRATPGELQRRLRLDTTLRPSLTGRDPVAEVPEVFAKRDAMYESVADMTIEVDSLAAEQVVIRAVQCVKAMGIGEREAGNGEDEC